MTAPSALLGHWRIWLTGGGRWGLPTTPSSSVIGPLMPPLRCPSSRATLRVAFLRRASLRLQDPLELQRLQPPLREGLPSRISWRWEIGVLQLPFLGFTLPFKGKTPYMGVVGPYEGKDLFVWYVCEDGLLATWLAEGPADGSRVSRPITDRRAGLAGLSQPGQEGPARAHPKSFCV